MVTVSSIARATLVVLLLTSSAFANVANAQRRPFTPRFGVGLEAVIVPDGNGILQSGLGVGIHGRIALPLNADLSAGLGMGLDGFVLNGSSEATYLATPEATLILTLPRGRGDGVRYILGGVAGYLPLTDTIEPGGPALVLGAGWAFPLRESSFYIELAPALVVGRSTSTVAVPVRLGVIF